MAFGSLISLMVALLATFAAVFLLSGPLIERASVQRLRSRVARGHAGVGKDRSKTHGVLQGGAGMADRILRITCLVLTRLGLGRAADLLGEHSPARRRRLEEVRRQLPVAIDAIGSSLAAGQSVQQSIAYVAGNVDDPLGAELREVVWNLEAGRSLDSALEGLEQRLPLPEVRYLRLAFRVQGRTGGSMREVLKSANESLRDAAEFERTLRSTTAQARLSAKVVGLTPVVLLGVVTLFTPDYLGTFFGSVAGLSMLFTAVLLDVAGTLWIRRIVRER